MVESCNSSKLSFLNYPLNCKTGAAATLTSALSALAVATAILALLASSGVNISPLNALGSLPCWASGLFLGGAGALAGTHLLWWGLKIKEQHRPYKARTFSLPHQKLAFAYPRPLLYTERSPLDPYFDEVVVLKESGYRIDADKRDELIYSVHQIKEAGEIIGLLEREKASENLFLRMLLKCRLVRIELENQHCSPFAPGDRIIPMCNAGLNRSPIIYGVLKLLYPEIDILPPHGALNGFDPAGSPDWDDFGPHTDAESPYYLDKQKGYALCYGRERPPRLGSDLHEQKSSHLKAWMDENLFRLQEKTEGRVIFIPLTQKAYQTVKARLEETRGGAIVASPLDYDDKIKDTHNHKEMIAECEELTNRFLNDLLAGKVFPF